MLLFCFAFLFSCWMQRKRIKWIMERVEKTHEQSENRCLRLLHIHSSDKQQWNCCSSRLFSTYLLFQFILYSVSEEQNNDFTPKYDKTNACCRAANTAKLLRFNPYQQQPRQKCIESEWRIYEIEWKKSVYIIKTAVHNRDEQSRWWRLWQEHLYAQQINM